MDEELGGHERCCEGEGEGVDGGEGGHGAVANGVWERAETDHAEDFYAVVLEGQGERFEALICADEAVHIRG